MISRKPKSECTLRWQRELEERIKGCTEHQRKMVLSKLKEIKRKNNGK